MSITNFDHRIITNEVPSSGFELLEAVQRDHSEQYKLNPLIGLIHADEILTNSSLQDSLLDVLQVWSNHFQKLIRIRAASAKNPDFSALADQHMQDEFNHNLFLLEMRGHRPVHLWDAELEGAAAWFAEWMAKGSDVEATILMHMVIEEAGDIFFKTIAPVFPDSQHFKVHSVADEGHAEIGLQILKKQSREHITHMTTTLNKGWAVMNLLCARMAELAIANAGCQNRRPPTAGQNPL